MAELSYIRRKYDSKGNYLRSETYDPLVYIQRASAADGPFWIDGGMQMSTMPGIKKQSLKALYQSEQLIPDGDFPLEAFADGGTLAKWSGNATILKKAINTAKGEYGVSMGSTNDITLAGYIESSPVLLEEDSNVSFRLTLSFQVNLPALQQTTPPTVYLQVKHGNYYLNDYGIWLLEESFIQVPVTAFRTPLTFIITPDFIKANGYLTVRIYELVASMIPTPAAQNTLQLDYLHVHLTHNGEDMPEELTFEKPNEIYRCTSVPDQIELFHADVPDYVNAQRVFKNALLLKNGEIEGVQQYDVTRSWLRLGEVEEKQIQQILLERLMAFSEIPRMRITGTIRARKLPLHTIIQDPSNRPKLFMLGSCSYNTADASYEVELLELDKTLPEIIRQMREFAPQEFNRLEFN